LTHHLRGQNQDTRCPCCGLPKGLCVCALAPRLDIRTEFIIVSHAKEMRRASNTARLAQLVMPGTRILLRGIKDRPIPPGELERQGAAMFVLFPADDAVEIDAALIRSLDRPLVIVVPDGSWRQAASAIRREEGLRGLTRLKLPKGPESRYVLRTQPSPGKVSTFEAIARVVGIVEGPEKQRALEAYLDEMVRRSLVASGNQARARLLDWHGEPD